MSNDANYYEVLGVEPGATAETIREAFTAAIGKFPKGTKARDDPAYRRVLQAFKVLSNPKRRVVYDSLLSETTPYSLKFDIQSSRSKLEISDSPQLLYLLVDVSAPEQEDADHPLNLCLVIDRSTSMKGIRLNRVVSAIELLLARLRPEDTISVVSFSDRANVVVPAGHVDNINLMSARIRSIEASGGTEIFQGLSAGVAEMKSVPLSKHTNHLILLTDGHTYGDAELCLELAQQCANDAIAFSALGIGTEWNDDFLDRLVAPSGGQSVFIESPSDIVDRLKDQISGLGQIYARNVRLLRQLPASISLKYGFKLAPFAQPLDIDTDQIKLGDIEGKTPLTFLLELDVAPQRSETRITLPLNFLADVPARAIKNRGFSNQFPLLILSEAPKVKPSPELIKAVRMLNMYRLNEKVWDEVEAGQLDQASARMQHLSTRLLEVGEAQLAKQAHEETRRLAQMGTMSEEGRKRLKYGTRALLSGAMDKWSADD